MGLAGIGLFNQRILSHRKQVAGLPRFSDACYEDAEGGKGDVRRVSIVPALCAVAFVVVSVLAVRIVVLMVTHTAN